MQKVTWRGTPGLGDCMWALNACHAHAHKTGVPVHLEMHWNHSEDFLYHFEDPETIVERMEYIHNYYHLKSNVHLTHVFNSFSDRYHKPEDEDREDKPRWWFESGEYPDMGDRKSPPGDWLFRKDTFRNPIQGKVVIWRPLFNAEAPTPWKTLLTNSEWQVIIEKLRRRGLNITELCYRTPIREAVYHISTARLVISYDGMWHYIARNFASPMVVISKNGVTKFHTPNAIRTSHNKEEHPNIYWWTEDLKNLLGHSKKKSKEYYKKVSHIYED